MTTVESAIASPACAKPPGDTAESRPHLRGRDVAADGTALVASSGCSSLVRISPRGAVTTVPRAESPRSPAGVAVAGGQVHVLEHLRTASDDRRERLPRVRKVARDGTISLLAVIEHREIATGAALPGRVSLCGRPASPVPGSRRGAFAGEPFPRLV